MPVTTTNAEPIIDKPTTAKTEIIAASALSRDDGSATARQKKGPTGVGPLKGLLAGFARFAVAHRLDAAGGLFRLRVGLLGEKGGIQYPDVGCNTHSV